MQTHTRKNSVIGAIAGDIIGSIFEWDNLKSKHFPLFSDNNYFTDDTVLSLCLANCILTKADFAVQQKMFYRRYPDAGFGGGFIRWCESDSMEPYSSWGNGASMKVSSIAHVAASLEEAMTMSEKYTKVTHNHPEGIKGAAATVAATYLALHNEPMETIKKHSINNFGYDITSKTLEDIRPSYSFDVSSQGTMPVALLAFFESTGYEDAIRNAISVGGDSDTIACITGSIAGAYYGVSDEIATKAENYLTPHLLDILKRFESKFII